MIFFKKSGKLFTLLFNLSIIIALFLCMIGKFSSASASNLSESSNNYYSGDATIYGSYNPIIPFTPPRNQEANIFIVDSIWVEETCRYESNINDGKIHIKWLPLTPRIYEIKPIDTGLEYPLARIEMSDEHFLHPDAQFQIKQPDNRYSPSIATYSERVGFYFTAGVHENGFYKVHSVDSPKSLFIMLSKDFDVSDYAHVKYDDDVKIYSYHTIVNFISEDRGAHCAVPYNTRLSSHGQPAFPVSAIRVGQDGMQIHSK